MTAFAMRLQSAGSVFNYGLPPFAALINPIMGAAIPLNIVDGSLFQFRPSLGMIRADNLRQQSSPLMHSLGSASMLWHQNGYRENPFLGASAYGWYRMGQDLPLSDDIPPPVEMRPRDEWLSILSAVKARIEANPACDADGSMTALAQRLENWLNSDLKEGDIFNRTDEERAAHKQFNACVGQPVSLGRRYLGQDLPWEDTPPG